MLVLVLVKAAGPAAASPPQSQAACLKRRVSSVKNTQARTPPRAPAQSQHANLSRMARTKPGGGKRERTLELCDPVNI